MLFGVVLKGFRFIGERGAIIGAEIKRNSTSRTERDTSSPTNSKNYSQSMNKKTGLENFG